MSAIEAKFSKVAHFEEQDAGQESRREKAWPEAVDIYGGEIGDRTVFIASPIGNKAVLRAVGPEIVELSIDQPTKPYVVAALAHAAFSKLAERGKRVNVVAFAPYHADNHEHDAGPMDPVYVDALGMDGGGITKLNDQLMYVGDSSQILDSATETLSHGKRPFIRSRFLPGEVA